MTQHEYAFDVKLFAVVRVTAASVDEARGAIGRLLDCEPFNVRFSDRSASLVVTEASAYTDDDGPDLFEIDGEFVAAHR